MALINIINRNIRLFLNSKLFLLLMVLGPLILIAIVGAALQDTSIKNVKAGIYKISKDSGDFGESFIQGLRYESFNIQNELNEEVCKQKVRDSETQVCLVMTEQNEGALVDLYVDFSKPRIVWGIIGTIQSVVEEEAKARRSITINILKQETENTIIKINEKEIKIQNAINRLNDIESQLEEAEETYESLREITENSEKEISTMISELESIGNPILYPLISNLKDIKTNLQNINNELNENPITPIKSDIRTTRTDLEQTKRELENVRRDLEEIRASDIERIMNPIELKYQSVSENQEIQGKVKGSLGFLDYLFPSFLIFFMLFGSIVFAAILRIRERTSNAYIRNIVSRASGFSFVFGDFITCLMLVSVQITIILFVASFFLNLSILPNLISLIMTILAISSLFTLIGLAIGSLVNSQESAIITSISISLLLFIFSSIITPIETLPSLIASIVSYSPLTLLETKLRIILIFSSKKPILLLEAISLITVGLISCLLIMIGYERNKEKEI